MIHSNTNLCRALVQPSTPNVTKHPFIDLKICVFTLWANSFISAPKVFRLSPMGTCDPNCAWKMGSSIRSNGRARVAHNVQHSSFALNWDVATSATARLANAAEIFLCPREKMGVRAPEIQQHQWLEVLRCHDVTSGGSSWQTYCHCTSECPLVHWLSEYTAERRTF